MNKKVNFETFKTVGFILLIVLIFVFFKKLMLLISDMFGTKEQGDKEERDREDEQETQNELDESKLTYTKSQYKDFANTIYTALEEGFTEDEDAIYTVFKRLKNNHDYYQLKLAYGKRLHGIYGFREAYNLVSAIRRLLNDDECKQINYIMSNRGLTTRI
jgi:hypothetical protein